MSPNKGTMGSVIPPALAKALSDRLYDKQRAATQKVEQLVVSALDVDDEDKIYALVAELATDFATSEREAARIGGLVALAATAVALTHINIRPFLPHMVPPMVSALSDGESKVRYFACESLYNVAKVSRGHILRWFNDIFDGLARVTADSVKTVKDGADYLDRLIKDIVAEQAATCLDWYENPDEDGDPVPSSGAGVGADEDVEPATAAAAATGNAEAGPIELAAREGPRLAFSLEKFVPLLSERMHTYKPSTRLYLIEWIRVLDSVPGLDLIVYLPEFLDGLLRFLSDPNDDVRNKTQSLLGEMLSEMRECVELRDADSDAASWQDGSTDGDTWGESRARARSRTMQSDVHAEGRFAEEGDALSPPASRLHSRAPPTSAATAAALGVLDGRRRSGSQLTPHWESRSAASLMSSALGSGQLHGVTDELRMAARRKRIRAARVGSALVPGASVDIDFKRCVDILAPHIESNDQEIQGTALAWMLQLTWLCPDVIVGAVPTLVNAVLPAVSHPMPIHRRTAEDVSDRLYTLVRDAPDPVRKRVPRVHPETLASLSPPALPPRRQQAVQRQSVAERPRPLSPVASSAVTTRTATAPSGIGHRPLSLVDGDAAGARSRAGSLPQATVDSGPASAMLSITATRSESPEEVTVETTQTDADAAANVVDGPEAGAATEAMTAVEDIAPAGGEQVGNTAEMEEVVEEPFNYEYAATSIMELFAKNVHEPTKVAGMHWLLLLHRKAPWRILTPDDMSFPVLLKMLGDSSEQVVKLDLELFAQISQHARGSDSLAPLSAGYNVNPQDVPYLSRFLGSLLQMFATDRALLETRAALMIRQLCVVLDPQLVFGLFAKLLVLPRYTPPTAVEAPTDANDADTPAAAWNDGDVADNESDAVGSDDGHGVAAGGDVFSIGGNEDSDAEEEGDESSDSAEDGPNDLEFVSVMVQHLSWILVTAPEAEPLRMMLRRFNAAITLSMPVLPALRLMLFGPSPLVYSAMPGHGQSGRYTAVRGRGTVATGGRARGRSSGVTGAPEIQLAKLAKLPRGPATGGGVPKPLALPRAGATGASATRGRSSTADSERARAKADASVRSGGRRPIPPVQRQGEQTEQQQQQRKERTREALVGAMDHVERRVAQNQQSHELFATLFRTWSHNPAACLTLCLLSQHYEMAAELIGIFGQLPQDLTVSFLVQLDKLVQLIESPVFAYLRLQLLDPQYHPMLVRTLYGLLMLLPQSSAFAILRNRLGSISAMPFAAPQLPAARPWSPATMLAGQRQPDSGGAGARQLHYHYHYHNHGIAHRATVGSAADQTRAGAQLNNALGVPPSEVAELVRQLAACGQSPTTMFLGPDSDDYDGAADAASLLRELAELNLGRAPADEPADSDADGDAGMSGYPAASTHGAETDLLNQYRAVRRHHAIARQKAGQST